MFCVRVKRILSHRPKKDTQRFAKLLQFAIMLFGASNYIAARMGETISANWLHRESISGSMAGQLMEILSESEYGKVQYPYYKKQHYDEALSAAEMF